MSGSLENMFNRSIVVYCYNQPMTNSVHIGRYRPDVFRLNRFQVTVCLIFYTVQYSDRSSRYTERYRRRSQESDSDESPGRSDHNSSSERDDAAIDKIADLLMEIQDNMKKILERLKRLETSLQQSQSVSDTLLRLCWLYSTV